jgi:hypothetical protein
MEMAPFGQAFIHTPQATHTLRSTTASFLIAFTLSGIFRAEIGTRK